MALWGCEGSDPLLVVDLKTDLLPGSEFVSAEVTREGGRTHRVPVDASEDALAGIRLAELEGLSSGDYDLEVVLKDAEGQVVVGRPVRVTLGEMTLVVTVVITRDCRGVACPADDPAAIACLGGQCVDPRCAEERPEECGTPECEGDGDCAPGSMCDAPRCVGGACLERPDDELCGPGWTCQASRGCVREPGEPEIAAGDDTTCLTRRAGDVWCWGSNRHGLLLTADVARGTTLPIAVAAEAVFTEVVSGSEHLCALDEEGGVHCWGRNDEGQLGDGSFEAALAPSGPIGGLPPLVGVAAGRKHTCGTSSDGRLFCWGAGEHGQLGHGVEERMTVPVEIAGLPPVRQLALGAEHTCALVEDGTVHCWGDNDLFQRGVAGPDTALPGPAIPGLASAEVIAAGEHSTCVVTTGGTLYCWGHNWAGQLGNGTEERVAFDAGAPVAGLPPVAKVGMTTGTTCVVATDGRAFCSGYGRNGNLGNGDKDDSSRFVEVESGQEWEALDGGDGHLCAIDASGGLACWGSGGDGTIGNGSTLDQSSPQPVSLPGPASDVAGGEGHTCALVEKALYCWGEGDHGQLGQGARTARATAGAASTSDLRGMSMEQHACALDGEGAVACWGANGDGPTSVPDEGIVWEPERVAGLEGPVEVEVGSTHSCARTLDGSIWCWGANWGGQLGDGSNDRSVEPVQVAGVSRAIDVSVGRFQSCALSDEGRVWCWGRDVADAAEEQTQLPGAVELAIGIDFVCARDVLGVIRCWGDGRHGRLGVEGISEAEPPGAPVPLPEPALEVSAGEWHVCALGVSGRLWCWGAGWRGALGVGDLDSRQTPTLVEGLTDVRDVTAGDNHTCAVHGETDVSCWGTGKDGKLGGGNFGSRELPARVFGLP